MIDFHCHLDLYPEPARVVQACKERGLFVLSVTTTPSAWEGTAALSAGAPRVRTALGLHPQIAHERLRELPLFDRLLPQVRYVGEIGLDGAPEFAAHMAAQRAAFDYVLRACANAGGRILSIHSRRAASAVLDALELHPDAGVPVLHWFSGARRELERAIRMGCWFSVGPAMLAGARGRALASVMPREHVVTESDGPFAQREGVPLMPWDVDDAVHCLADVWSLSPAEASEMLVANARSLFEMTSDGRKDAINVERSALHQPCDGR